MQRPDRADTRSNSWSDSWLESREDMAALTAAERRTSRRVLSYHDRYLCPVCRHGEISGITLVDAFACNFCRHIFTADLAEQIVRVEDSSQPITWRWNGRKWQAAQSLSLNLTIVVWLIGGLVVLLPPGLIGLSAHLFPPLPGSRWDWFPSVWVGLTFLLHFGFVAWLLAEHYQLPLYITCKIRLQNWRQRR